MQKNTHNTVNNIENFIPLLQEAPDNEIMHPKKVGKSFFNSVMNKLSDEFNTENNEENFLSDI